MDITGLHSHLDTCVSDINHNQIFAYVHASRIEHHPTFEIELHNYVVALPTQRQDRRARRNSICVGPRWGEELFGGKCNELILRQV